VPARACWFESSQGHQACLLSASVRGPHEAFFFLEHITPTKQHQHFGPWQKGNQLPCGMMTEHYPASIEECIARLIEQQDRRPLPELGGLSLEQVYLLNRCGWWADPFPIRLEPNLSWEQVAHTPFLHDVRAFLQATDEFNGAPTTAEGNLNRAFVAHMLELLALPPGRLEMIQRVCKVVNEPDVWALHTVRVVCEVGRLVRKYKKRFVVTSKARELLRENRAGVLYHYLFHTMFREFNLDYISDWAKAPGIQATLPYQLYRIGQLPLGQDHDIESLAPVVFVPALQQEIRTVFSHEDAPEWLLKVHLLRALESFGLVQMVQGPAKPPGIDLMNRMRRLPLFDAFIRFHL
jgi:hypothetical protein